MIYFKKAYNIIKEFLSRLSDENISAYSAEAAFFLFISFFPFVMLLITLLEYLPITENVLADIAVKLLPENINIVVLKVIEELSARANKTVISLTALLTLWSASKGVFSVIKGMNKVCGVEETRGYIRVRLSALFYTLVFAGGILFALILLVFGGHIFAFLSSKIYVLKQIEFVLNIRQLTGFVVLFIFFWLIYVFAPNRKSTFLKELPGALFSSMGWILFSMVFSFYLNNMSDLSYFYGSLTTVVVLMLWLYICMYIVFLGAEINDFLANKTGCRK